jgi:hypothetical protein
MDLIVSFVDNVAVRHRNRLLPGNNIFFNTGLAPFGFRVTGLGKLTGEHRKFRSRNETSGLTAPIGNSVSGPLFISISQLR